MLTRTRIATLATLAFSWLQTGTGLADEPATVAPAAKPSRVIQVSIAAPPDEREAMTQVLRELMLRLSVELEVAAVERVERRDVLAAIPPGSRYLARAFIDLPADGQGLLYVHDPVRDRVLERKAERRGPGEAELAREELGHMLLASIEGLLAGALLGAPREELAAAEESARRDAAVADGAATEPTMPAAAPRERSRTGWALSGALLYEVAALGHEPGFTHGPMLAGLVVAPEPALGLLLSAQYRVPIDEAGELVGVRMSAFALRALATFEAPLSGRLALRLGLGVGTDVTRISPESATPERISLTADRTLLLGITRGLVGIDVRVSRLLALWAAIALDIDLDRTRYVLVHASGDGAAVLAPWRVRPALSLGVVLP